MSIELPYAGPNHVWSIGEKRRVVKKGEPDYPENYDEDRYGPFAIQAPALILNVYVIDGQSNGNIIDRKTDSYHSVTLTTEENANAWAEYMAEHHKRDGYTVEPVGPWYSDYTEEVVRFEGGFLGIGRKRVVTHEKKLLGWNFKKPRAGEYKFLPEGFTQRDVLEAAQDVLTEKRNTDHVRALRMETNRHIGYYPPKKLSEQFPDKA